VHYNTGVAPEDYQKPHALSMPLYTPYPTKRSRFRQMHFRNGCVSTEVEGSGTDGRDDTPNLGKPLLTMAKKKVKRESSPSLRLVGDMI
jgi:hypothetical protein